MGAAAKQLDCLVRWLDGNLQVMVVVVLVKECCKRKEFRLFGLQSVGARTLFFRGRMRGVEGSSLLFRVRKSALKKVKVLCIPHCGSSPIQV